MTGDPTMYQHPLVRPDYCTAIVDPRIQGPEIIWSPEVRAVLGALKSPMPGTNPETTRLRDALNAILALTGATQPRPWTALSQIDTLARKALAP